eukprot:CAMPEP_0202861866 /NCGR_PEP_ID=MMETSP1391-20130828/3111_1 /ASSEMBLY_ACC=CAM_ASM_000867 /TAXON_ID=1034604 /ORGANISM="Chlamydomonas leiostraca, Strain SAG 11-49" /LENGTH=200 /DNA_ID=CAMNT_0049541307 /DNA_START=51 /DNA_END=653 /DNA_ORIENTATION=-
MTEAELIAQLAPGEVFVHITADMLAALGSKKKRKAEVEVFPEDEGRWAPDAPAIKMSQSGTASASTSAGGAGPSGAASSANTSAGGALVSGTLTASTSAGGALSMASTSAGGATSNASTSAGGAVVVEIVPVDAKAKGVDASKPAPLPELPAEEALEVKLERMQLDQVLGSKPSQQHKPVQQKSEFASMLCACFAPSVQH